MFETRLSDPTIEEIPLPHNQPSFAFIDADNVWKSYDKHLDSYGLTAEEKEKFEFFRLFQILPHDRRYVYSATNEDTAHPQWLSGLENEAGFLLKMGELITKGRGKKQEGVDVKLAIDATRLAYSNIMKTCTLYGADGDFLPLVEAVSEAGTLINIASFNDPGQGRVAPKLRARADKYFRMNHLWLNETLSPRHRTVENYSQLQHQWPRASERNEVEFHGQKCELRKTGATWIVKLTDNRNVLWRGSHNYNDLVIWLKVMVKAAIEDLEV